VDQDQAETELTSTQKTLAFTILPGTGGEFFLQEVVGNLDFPVAMATVPDGQIFVTELSQGNIRVVTPTAQLPWQLQAAPFATLPVVMGIEKGLLGIEVDPNFDVNGFVYVYYTTSDPNTASGFKNRVVRFTATTSGGDTVAAPGGPIVIVDNLPAAADQHGHNGGHHPFRPRWHAVYRCGRERGRT
jgi:glucose/arabinose dehydrogenase